MGFAAVDGAHLYYEAAGSGPAIVFIHGFSFDSRMWDEQFQFFSKNFKVIRYDMRGFGRSSLPSGKQYSHAADLRDLLENLRIARTSIIGLSRGGSVCVDFCLAHEPMVDAMVVADSSPAGFPVTPTSGSPEIIRTAREEGIGAAKELWLNQSTFEFTRLQGEIDGRIRQMVNDYSGWHWVNEDTARYLNPRAEICLPHLTAPTLIMVGEFDHKFQIAARMLHGLMACAEEVVLPGVGHVINMEAPKLFNETVLRFLQMHVVDGAG